MVDRTGDGASLGATWRALGHRAAASGGSLVALVSLLNHVPITTVCLRGGATWLAVLLTARLGGAALERAAGIDRERSTQADGTGAAPGDTRR